ncbi:uncharacterized protein LOC134253750 [Saccostrea cucullata]|uniref:uncharacterized protein LOC134253750 n=1 Tax=Saccostrea cuccullata TaxID=36930 RepID=UPI002ED4E4FB
MNISTTPSPDTTFVNTSPSPSSRRDYTFNRTFSTPSSTSTPEITTDSARDTTPSASSDKVTSVCLFVILILSWIARVLLRRMGLTCRLPVKGDVRANRKPGRGEDIEMREIGVAVDIEEEEEEQETRR